MDQLKTSQSEKMSQSLQQIPQKVDRTSNHGSCATVERTSTFRVDEAIAKSTLRQTNDDNNNRSDYSNNGNRPTSWHLEHSCSDHNRLFPNGLPTPYGGFAASHYDSTPNSASKMYNSDFSERLWTDRQLTT